MQVQQNDASWNKERLDSYRMPFFFVYIFIWLILSKWKIVANPGQVTILNNGYKIFQKVFLIRLK